MTKVIWRGLGVLLIGGAAACGAPGQEGAGLLQDDPVAQGVTSENGLTAVNGLSATNGLTATNGLMTTNGLSTTNGLMTTNGLSATNGLMTTNGGRSTVEYLAKCALSNNDFMDKLDNTGVSRRYYGKLGVASGWKNGACDSNCQQKISACMMAHMNSTGAHVPIFINGDPSSFPSVGVSMPYESSSDAAIQEGVFFGNMLASNPPEAYYVKGKAFKANIPGRLGASTSNPYKPFEGYRVDHSYAVSAHPMLCWERTMADGEHQEFDGCTAYTGPNGSGSRRHWDNTLTTYVNKNYNGAVSQDWVARTFNFDGDSVGKKTNDTTEVFSPGNGFDFHNSVGWGSSGVLEVLDNHGGKRLCPGDQHVVITKNSGEPFSLTGVRINHRWGSSTSTQLTVTAYVKGSSTRKQMTVTVPPNYGGSTNHVAPTFSGWDNLLKVEIRTLGDLVCVDDVKLKT